MDEERLDLSALEAGAEARLERSVQAILARAKPALDARRAQRAGVWDVLGAWRRPVLAAAALLALVCAVVLGRVPAPQRATTAGSANTASRASTERRATTLTEAAGVPASLARSIESGSAPGADVLLEF